MIVCSCLRVSDRDVRAAIRAGAETVEAVTAACGAGSRCGGCHPALCELLARRDDQPAPAFAGWLRQGGTGVRRAG